MATENRIVPVLYAHRGKVRTRPVYQHSYGQVLHLEGFANLPPVFEMHYGAKDSVEADTRIGEDGFVVIPDPLLEQPGPISAWLFLHDTGYDGETCYEIEIPVRPRPAVPPDDLDPEQKHTISRAIAVLNEAVARTETAAERAEQAADNAGYMFAYIDDETGHLMYLRTDSVDVDLALDEETGDLLMLSL